MKSIAIRYHQEPDGWWAESEALPGWTAVGGNLDEVRAQAASAVRAFVDEHTVLEEEGLPVGPDVPKAAG
jgi:predicted RNase H-like HicB family nuclease